MERLKLLDYVRMLHKAGHFSSRVVGDLIVEEAQVGKKIEHVDRQWKEFGEVEGFQITHGKFIPDWLKH